MDTGYTIHLSGVRFIYIYWMCPIGHEPFTSFEQ